MVDANTNDSCMGRARHELNQNAAQLFAVEKNVIRPFKGDFHTGHALLHRIISTDFFDTAVQHLFQRTRDSNTYRQR